MNERQRLGSSKTFKTEGSLLTIRFTTLFLRSTEPTPPPECLTDNCNQQAQNGHQSIADNTHANGSYRASVSASALSVCNAESALDCTALSPTNLMTERSSIHHHQNECPLLCDGLQGRKRVPPCLQARRRDSRRCDQTWRSQSGCRRCCLPPRGS